MASDVLDSGLDDDPVMAEYDVHLTPQDEAQQIYVLQYPNRNRHESFKKRQWPSNMRAKQDSGFVELDIPMQFTNYDRAKGMRWGGAMKNAKEDGINSFGISGGFAPLVRSKGRTGPASVGRTTEGLDDQTDMIMDVDDVVVEGGRVGASDADFGKAQSEGRVLNIQTLGGQIIKSESGRPLYMVAGFVGAQLHMTPAAGVVQLRPQFHHIDAQARIDQLAKRRATAEAYPTAEPQAIFDRAKATDGTEEAHHLLTIQTARVEQWKPLQYHHEETEESYGEYQHVLFAANSEAPPAISSTVSNEDYLDAISAPRSDPSGRLKKRPMTKKQIKNEDEVSDESDAPGVAPHPPR